MSTERRDSEIQRDRGTSSASGSSGEDAARTAIARHADEGEFRAMLERIWEVPIGGIDMAIAFGAHRRT